MNCTSQVQHFEIDKEVNLRSTGLTKRNRKCAITYVMVGIPILNLVVVIW